jgi:hypothetical protein
MKAIDDFFLHLEEPIKGCLLALKTIILTQDKDISTAWKYRLPFFCYKEKMFCYLWVHKKKKQPYLGMVEGKWLNHPELIAENRSRMKILLLDPHQDLPLHTIHAILKEALLLYKTGVVAIKS